MNIASAFFESHFCGVSTDPNQAWLQGVINITKKQFLYQTSQK
jgi:hypothetical protein